MEKTRSLRVQPDLWDRYGEVTRAENLSRGADLRQHMERRVRDAEGTAST